jgi:hypothetical protein
MRLLAASAYPIGPSADYARALSLAFNRLRSATTGPLAELSAARTPSAQASAATRLAQAYEGAAVNLRRTAVPPMVRDVHSAIVADLSRLARGYSDAAAAAQSSATGGYSDASRSIGTTTAALDKALQGLTGLGYTVGGH